MRNHGKGDKDMKNWKKIAGLFFPILALVGFLSVWDWAQEQCVEFFASFAESFDDTDFRDADNTSVDHWGDGYITLNNLGADFAIRNPRYLPNWINTITVNDFNNDGWPDFVASSSSYSNVLAFVENMGHLGESYVGTFDITHWIDGSTGNASDYPTAGVRGQAIDTSGHCGMTSGDYDGDGDCDFWFIVSNDNSTYSIKRIWLYENRLVQTGSVSFVQVDKTAAWSPYIRGIAWSSTMMASVDLDDDGDLDLVSGNGFGQVIRIINRQRTRAISHGQKWTTPDAMITTGWAPRGVSTVSFADYDNDGDDDLMLGSVSYGELRYYKQNAGVFSLYRTYSDASRDTRNNLYDGAATVTIASDFDKDGDVDLIVGTDNWNYMPGAEAIGGMVYYMRNSGDGEFQSRLIFDGRAMDPSVYDFDLGMNFDFDQDGDDDFLIADGNHTENYYLFVNQLADVYNLQGIAQSTNITPALSSELHAITRVRVHNLQQSVVGGPSTGLAVTLYVSNNDGRNWEFYDRFLESDIRDYASLDWYTFKHYGSRLRWRAILTAEDDNIPEFPNASYETPRIDNIEFEIVYVERREYSRTSVAASAVDDSGDTVKLIIAGTFYYPGWQGHLVAYDVTDMAPLNTSYSELRTVSRSDPSIESRREIVAEGVEIRWDAGQLLNLRSAASRTVYTALPDPVGEGFNRIGFETTNVASLDDYLQDVEGDNGGLIDFVRGEGRYWKLGDINHSNPIVVGPPDGSPTVMGEGYESFRASWSDRPEVLYVGANDGLIHCFDILTGEELWGFIPFNLLPKLKNMYAVDQTTLERYFNRDTYVDGSPVAADVYLDGAWKTILVCGQGPGSGSVAGGGKNFYFALDVTDPENPLPLWELTDVDTMGETWSVPVIGRVTKDGGQKWVAFMGSGYDNNPDPGMDLGNVFYAVDLGTGQIFWTHTAADADTSTSVANGNHNIPNAIPGSPALVDIGQNGTTDRVYFGDLDGRLWKVDVSDGFADMDSWTAEAIYTDPDHFPIITKPAVWMNSTVQTAAPRIYFGTGGDDACPGTSSYAFIALIDQGATAEIEWFIGTPDAGGVRPDEKHITDFLPGEKIWADPKIADYTVYFSTLMGSIESVDPCENLAGAGRLFARFIVSYAGSSVGGTAFKTSSGPQESLDLAIKTRSAVTLGEQQTTTTGVRKREVYIQEYDSTVQKLEQLTGGIIKIKSWREIYKIIKR
jgi:hypothetical protein